MDKKSIKEYQCSGCVCGSSPEDDCFDCTDEEDQCSKHCAGTSISNIGRIFLGMPKGFDRLGRSGSEKNPVKIYIYKSFDELKRVWEYDFLNVPCWKYKNDKGHVFVRGMSPRINEPFLHIILEDCIDKVNCHELTPENLQGMD